MKSASFKVPSPYALEKGMDAWRTAAASFDADDEGDMELNLFKNREGGAVDLAKGLQVRWAACTRPDLRDDLAHPFPACARSTRWAPTASPRSTSSCRS